MLIEIETASLLTDKLIISIVGVVLTAMAGLLLLFVKSAWKERKEMLLTEISTREKYNENLQAEMKAVKETANNQKVETVKLNGSVNELNATLQGVQGWLGKVDGKQDKLDEKVQKHDREIGEMKGKKTD